MAARDSTAPETRARLRWLHSAALGLAISFVLAGAVLAISISSGRALQVDEIEHIHATYNLRSGLTLYRDFWEGHNPLLYLLLYPVVDPDAPVEAIASARNLMLAVWLVTVAAAARLSHRWGGGWAALATAGFLVTHTTFVERGMEVRPDGLLAAFTLLALVAGTTDRPRLRSFFLQGLLLGLAFLATQKAVFACVVFGIGWLVLAVRRRRPALVLLPCLAWAIPVALMIGGLILTGSLQSYLQTNLLDAARHATIRSAAFSPWSGIVHESARNVAFVLVASGGLAWGLWRCWRYRDPGFLLVVSVTVGGLASLWLNPFPFPYLHVSVLPPLAVLAGAALSAGLSDGRLRKALLVTAALLLAAVTAWPRLLDKAMPSMDAQLANLQTVQAVTGPSDPVFDLVGLYFRPDAYPVFTMTGVMMQRYRHGYFPRMIPAFEQRGLVAAMINYRTRWLPKEESEFLASHLTHYDGNVFVLGREIEDLAPGETMRFEALATKRFRFEGQGTLLIDDAPFRSGVIAQGIHEITAGEPAPSGRLILDVPPPTHARPPGRLYVNFD